MGGGGWGAGQNLTEIGFVHFLVLKLIYSGFNVLNLFTESLKITVLFGSKGGLTFSRGGG